MDISQMGKFQFHFINLSTFFSLIQIILPSLLNSYCTIADYFGMFPVTK